MKRIFAAIEFLIFYLKEVFVSNMKVAHDVLTPTLHMNPALVHVPLEQPLSDVQLTALANLITMTPGTLSVDVAEDRKSLFIHAMYFEGEAALKEEVEDKYIKRILNVLK